MITGESIPVGKGPGARVIGATVNGTGSLVMRAERVGSETLLAQIVQMVSQAQRSRAPIQRLADRVAAWFVPAVIAIAVAHVRGVEFLRARTPLGARFGQRCGCADYCLPVCAGAGHADRNHGWHRTRRPGWSTDQERRSARSAGKSGHPGGGQDRNAHGRQATRHIRRRRAGTDRKGIVASGSQRRAGKRAPAWGCGRKRCQRSRVRRSQQSVRFSLVLDRESAVRWTADRFSSATTGCFRRTEFRRLGRT